MSTQTTNAATAAFLKESLSILVRNHGPEDIVATLAIVMDDYSTRYAQKTGDYSGAATMAIVARHLESLEDYLENYDPTLE